MTLDTSNSDATVQTADQPGQESGGTETTETVRQFIIDNFLLGDASRFNDEDSFIETGIVDSTGMLELVDFLEETYGITVEDEELIPPNLDGLGNVVAFIRRKATA